MNIQDLGAIGELISSLAVLITLIYVAVQLRETRNALGAQAYQARTLAQQDALLRVSENDELAQIMVKIQDQDGEFDASALDRLTAVERRKLTSFQTALALRHDNTAFQYLSGYITDADAENLMAGLPKLLPFWKALGITRQPPALQRYIKEKAPHLLVHYERDE